MPAPSTRNIIPLLPLGEVVYRGYKRIIGPQALPTSPATLYTVPDGVTIDLRHVYVNNPTGGEIEFTLSIGVDAAGTRFFDQHPVSAGDAYDANISQALVAGEMIQGFADSSSAVVVIDAYLYPVG